MEARTRAAVRRYLLGEAVHPLTARQRSFASRLMLRAGVESAERILDTTTGYGSRGLRPTSEFTGDLLPSLNRLLQSAADSKTTKNVLWIGPGGGEPLTEYIFWDKQRPIAKDPLAGLRRKQGQVVKDWKYPGDLDLLNDFMRHVWDPRSKYIRVRSLFTEPVPSTTQAMIRNRVSQRGMPGAYDVIPNQKVENLDAAKFKRDNGGPVSIAYDGVSAMTYGRNPKPIVENELRTLEPGGRLFIAIPMETLKITNSKPSRNVRGNSLGKPDLKVTERWFGHIEGARLVSFGVERSSMMLVELERTAAADGEIQAPNLRQLRYRESTTGRGPERSYFWDQQSHL
jgi:hypothetical protein